MYLWLRRILLIEKFLCSLLGIISFFLFIYWFNCQCCYSPSPELNPGEIALNQRQRSSGGFTLEHSVDVRLFESDLLISSMEIHLDILGKKSDTKFEFNTEQLSHSFTECYNEQCFVPGQLLVMDYDNVKLDMKVVGITVADLGNNVVAKPDAIGMLSKQSTVMWKKISSSQNHIVFIGNAAATTTTNLFKEDFDFEKIGIGGLDAQFKEIFRRAFASRLLPGIAKKMGTNFVRGILLYGPPGCGKTLIARQIGRILNAKEPKIINGPEILDKYVGGSEEKIRALFVDAEEDQKKYGDDSELHIIIFDEMDAIMKSRGSTRDNTGVADNVVNQLLSKIDGVNSLNNVLIIGMTNRIDLIDEAILRPGRLEVHIEITLPDKDGRLQILNIKTANMRENNKMDEEAIRMLPDLAEMTKNFTGAELEEVVRDAASTAINRCIDKNFKPKDPDSIKVTYDDFVSVIQDFTPAFGNKNAEELDALLRHKELCEFGSTSVQLRETINMLISRVMNSEGTPLMSILLRGSPGSGKSALAAHMAKSSEFPFIRMIAPDSFIGLAENQKSSQILSVFKDAYRSPLSLIFIDDIERLIEFIPQGYRFANGILQTLLVLIKKVPIKNSRLCIIATTSCASHLQDLGLAQAFDTVLEVPLLETPKEVSTVLTQYSEIPPSEIKKISSSLKLPIGIKKLLMVLEMARAEKDTNITANSFLECYHTIVQY